MHAAANQKYFFVERMLIISFLKDFVFDFCKMKCANLHLKTRANQYFSSKKNYKEHLPGGGTNFFFKDFLCLEDDCRFAFMNVSGFKF